MVVHSRRSSSGVLGGKNSKENVGLPPLKLSLTECAMPLRVVSAAVADPADSNPVSNRASNPASPPPALPQRIDAELAAFLAARTAQLAEISPDLGVLSQAFRAAVLNGGKRLRPTFAYWGWRCVQ